MNLVNNISKRFALAVVGSALALALPALVGENQAQAQLNPMGTMYFQNQYLANPAMAGLEAGVKLNVAYRQQWNSLPGAPRSQSFTGEYGFGNNVGVGVNVYNTKTGLIQQTSVQATYAYHFQVAEDQKLNLGLSLGASRQSIRQLDITGDNFDPSVNRFNDRGVQVDGDVGAAYNFSKLQVQAAILGLRNLLVSDPNQEDYVNYPTFFSSVSYRFDLEVGGQTIGLEPKVAYRGIRETDNILDAGANVSFLDNNLQVFGLYHSTKAATLGFSVGYKSRVAITGIYTTSNPEIKDYTGGGFEIGLRLALQKQ